MSGIAHVYGTPRCAAAKPLTLGAATSHGMLVAQCMQVAWTARNTVLYPAICSLAGLVAGAASHTATHTEAAVARADVLHTEDERLQPCSCVYRCHLQTPSVFTACTLPVLVRSSVLDMDRHVWRGRRHREGAADAGDGGAARRGGGHQCHHDHVRQRHFI
jgi:hypothetical protein